MFRPGIAKTVDWASKTQNLQLSVPLENVDDHNYSCLPNSCSYQKERHKIDMLDKGIVCQYGFDVHAGLSNSCHPISVCPPF